MAEIPKPPDRRPYRPGHEPGDELTIEFAGRRTVFRQVGWHGQTGAFYSLDEDPSPYERGSFGALWIIAHSDEIIEDD